MVGGMISMQLYMSEQLKKALLKEYGEGRVSANVERIIRAHLANPAEEKKLRLQELNQEIRRFNADYDLNAELIFPEPPPKPTEVI